MKTETHSEAGPSSFQRIIDCPGSYRRGLGLPSVSSFASREGTLCHLVSEEYLLEGIEPESQLGAVREVEGYEHKVSQQMIDAVKVYTEAVWGSMTAGDQLLIEEHVDLTWIHPIIGHGSVDAGIIRPRAYIKQWDLKYGTTVVNVQDNAQFSLYTLGLLGEHNKMQIDRAYLGVVQPRDRRKTKPKVRQHELPASELYRWVDDVARPACIAALDPESKPKKCKGCFFCKAKGISCELWPTTYEPTIPVKFGRL